MSSHISPKTYTWRIKRFLLDTGQTFIRILRERYKSFIFKMQHPYEAHKTKGNVFLVYTMGKVASMSVLGSIQNRLPHNTCFAMHFLNPVNLKKQEELLSESIYQRLHTKHANKILKHLKDNTNKKVKVVSIVREPVSQLISQLFQYKSMYDLEQLMNLGFENKYIDYDYGCNWITMELNTLTRMDVLSQPFNKEKGYEIYENGNISLLIMKFELLDCVFEKAMNEFTGVNGWKLELKNVSSSKEYAKEYHEFKSKVLIEKALLEYSYATPYSKHYYTEEEISSYKAAYQESK
jgi:hypothetical protein